MIIYGREYHDEGIILRKNLKNSYLLNDLRLVFTFTLGQLKSRYRKTFAGLLWVILTPILNFLVQAIIFKYVLKDSTHNYLLYFMTGLMPWIFLSSTLNLCAGLFIDNRPMLLAYKIQPWILILTNTFDQLINFLISYLILILLLNVSLLIEPLSLIFTLIAILNLTFFTFSLGFILAICNVFLRDTQFVLQFFLSIAYIATPIFYEINYLPLFLQTLMKFNPFHILIDPFRHSVYIYDLPSYLNASLISFSLSFTTFIFMLLIWKYKKNDLLFNI